MIDVDQNFGDTLHTGVVESKAYVFFNDCIIYKTKSISNV